MKIAIYDKGNGHFEGKAGKAAHAVCDPSSIAVLDDVDFREVVDNLRAFTHIVCHLRSDCDRETGELLEPSWPKLVDHDADLLNVEAIIRVSSQGASGMSDSFRRPYRHNDKGPWILHMIEPSGSVTEDRWKAIFQALKAWDTSRTELSAEIRSIFDPSSERLALRLLCEAWIATKGERFAPIANIVVNAPMDLTAWLLPFAVDDYPASVDQFAKRLGITEEMQRDILTVLKASGAGTLTWDDSAALVERLSSALKTASR